eukprot:762639-Hanusia_phi.AAC.1
MDGWMEREGVKGGESQDIGERESEAREPIDAKQQDSEKGKKEKKRGEGNEGVQGIFQAHAYAEKC